MRERERTELLNQYKHLNDEVETSVNQKRQLESRVSFFLIIYIFKYFFIYDEFISFKKNRYQTYIWNSKPKTKK